MITSRERLELRRALWREEKASRAAGHLSGSDLLASDDGPESELAAVERAGGELGILPNPEPTPAPQAQRRLWWMEDTTEREDAVSLSATGSRGAIVVDSMGVVPRKDVDDAVTAAARKGGPRRCLQCGEWFLQTRGRGRTAKRCLSCRTAPPAVEARASECGHTYARVGGRVRRWCSEECRARHKPHKLEVAHSRICVGCGARFEADLAKPGPPASYHSNRCRRRTHSRDNYVARPRAARTLPCPWCGRPARTGSRAAYCSQECKRAAERARRAKRPTTPQLLTCEECGHQRTWYPSTPGRLPRFCSWKCWSRSRKKGDELERAG